MALYNIDKNTSPTQSYYNSIASPVVNNTTGVVNPGMAKSTTAPQLNSGALWRNQILGMSGIKQGTSPNLAGMPDWIKNQYSQVDTSTAEGGNANLWNMPGLAMTDKNGKQVIMLTDDGKLIDASSRALNDNFDFATMGRYDPDLGWVTDIENTNDSPWQRHLGQSRAIAGSVLTAMGGAAALYGGAGAAAGAGAADVAVPANLPALTPTTVGSLGPAAELAGAGTAATTAAGAGTNLGSYAGMSTGLDGAAGSTLSVGSPVAGATGVNAAIGTAAQATGGLTIGDILRGGGNLASIFGQQRNNAAYQNAINNAANRADPFGQYRSAAGQRLMDLINDPSLVTKVPGYEFRRTQGEQGINRNDSMGGYGRSGNRLYDISKFNSDYASSEYDKEFNRLARMAGVDVNPATAGTIAAGGAAQGYNNNQSTLGAWLSGVARFSDWLDGGGAGRAASSFASAGDTLSGLFA